MLFFRVVTIALAATAFSVSAGTLPRWKIVYGTTEGPEGRAIELLTSDVGEILLREPGVYATHVMPFCLGVTSRKTYDDDVAIQSGLWRNFEEPWISGYAEAHAAAKMIHTMGPEIEMNMAAQINSIRKIVTKRLLSDWKTVTK